MGEGPLCTACICACMHVCLLKVHLHAGVLIHTSAHTCTDTKQDHACTHSHAHAHKHTCATAPSPPTHIQHASLIPTTL